MSFDQIIGGVIGVIVAGLPAMIALLKIKELHIVINSALSAFIAATKQQAEERIVATKLEADVHFQDLKQEMELVRHRNDQLLDQLAETVKRLPVISEDRRRKTEDERRISSDLIPHPSDLDVS